MAKTNPSNAARKRPTRRGPERPRQVTRELVVEGGMGCSKDFTTLVGLTERSVEECNRLREEFEEVSWRKRGLWKTEELCPREDRDLLQDSEPRTRKHFLNSWLLDDVEDKAEERENINQETKEDESGSRKREVERERERVETSSESICVDRLDGLDVGRKVLEPFCSSSEVENVGISVNLSLCVLASPPVVPVVTVPFSDVNLVCEAVFCDSDCEIVEPQTFSFSRKREASVALECETEMNIEGPPVRAVPESIRKRPTPHSSPFTAGPDYMRSRAPPPPEGTPLQHNGGALEGRKGGTPKWRSGETQLLLGVRSPTWQQLGFEAPKRRVIPFCPKCELVEKVRRKIRDPLSKPGRHRRKEEQQYAQCLGGDTSLCLSTSSDELHGAEK